MDAYLVHIRIGLSFSLLERSLIGDGRRANQGVIKLLKNLRLFHKEDFHIKVHVEDLFVYTAIQAFLDHDTLIFVDEILA